MSSRAAGAKYSNLCWVVLGLLGAGCLDPLIEDPGSVPKSDDGNVPLPIGPNGQPGPGVTSAAASSTPIAGVAPTSGGSSATATTTATASSGATTTQPVDAVAPIAPAGSDQAATTSEPGASGTFGDSDSDAGAFEEPDAEADAGPDGSASNETTAANALPLQDTATPVTTQTASNGD